MDGNGFDDLVNKVRSKTSSRETEKADFDHTVNQLNEKLTQSRQGVQRASIKKVTPQFLLWRFLVGAVTVLGLCFACNLFLLRMSIDYPAYLGFIGALAASVIAGLLNIVTTLIHRTNQKGN